MSFTSTFYKTCLNCLPFVFFFHIILPLSLLRQKYFPVFLTCVLYVQLILSLYAISSFMCRHILPKNYILHFFCTEQLSSTCLELGSTWMLKVWNFDSSQYGKGYFTLIHTMVKTNFQNNLDCRFFYVYVILALPGYCVIPSRCFMYASFPSNENR
jgi:hypothetical protein